MIIGLHGQMHVGKDTVANHLVEKYGFERRGFADKVKEAVAALWNISVEQVNEFKIDNVGTLPRVEVMISEAVGDGQVIEYTFSWREHLQRFGTDMGRKIFGEDFWRDLAMQDMDEGKDYVFSDVRFENEAREILRRQGSVVRIFRPGLENDSSHESEKPLSRSLIDMTIYNSWSIEDLYGAVDRALPILRKKVLV